MKFLCDQMLARLGRWLRAAGYDTAIIDIPLPDQEIFQKAMREERKLLTRDHSLYEMHKDSNLIVWLEANTLEECVRDLSKKVPVNWCMNPFSRCLICNEVLSNTLGDGEKQQVPEDILSNGRTLWYCHPCKKAYWEGSHTKRMLHQLLSWKNQHPFQD